MRHILLSLLLGVLMAGAVGGTASAGNFWIPGGRPSLELREGLRLGAALDLCNAIGERSEVTYKVSSVAPLTLTVGATLQQQRLYIGLGGTFIETGHIGPTLQVSWNALPYRFTPVVDLKINRDVSTLGLGLKVRFTQSWGLYLMGTGALHESKGMYGATLGISYGF